MAFVYKGLACEINRANLSRVIYYGDPAALLKRNCNMLSIHGPAMNRHSAKRAASGCPSILGGRPRPVAHYRDFAPELDR
jgi:hypothetical protein